MHARHLGKRTQVNLLLPGNPAQTTRTLWLLHGMTGDHTSWLVSSDIEQLAERYGIAVVMPNADLSFYVDMAYGADYNTFIAEELPSYLRRYFPLSKERQDNFIAGFSMGGYGAFEIGLSHPDKYAAAVSLSGPMYISWIYDTLTDVAFARAADTGDAAAIEQETQRYIARTGLPEQLVRGLLGDAGTRTRRTFLAMYGQDAKPGETSADITVLCRAMKECGQSLRLMAYCGTEDLHYPSNVAFAQSAKEMALDYSLKTFSGTHNWAFWSQCTPDFLDRLFGEG